VARKNNGPVAFVNDLTLTHDHLQTYRQTSYMKLNNHYLHY